METREFVQWMKERNDSIPLGDKTLRGLGFYGMDVRAIGLLHPTLLPCASKLPAQLRLLTPVA